MSLCLNLEYEDSRHCSRLLDAHHEDLADMVTAEFTGEEMCYYMKYCTPPSSLDALANAGVGDVGECRDSVGDSCERAGKIPLNLN